MKKGFTLAEVLITLAIIGVVAALTIPSVVANTQQQEFKTGLKKAVNVLNDAITTIKATTGETPYDNIDLYNYLKQHMSIMNEVKPKGDISASTLVGRYNLAFYTTDGMRFEFPNEGMTSNTIITHETGARISNWGRPSPAGKYGGYCGSYGLDNPNGTKYQPCVVLVDVNGDRKPTLYGANKDVSGDGKSTINNYKYPSPDDKRLTDVFNILITEDKAIPFGVVAQRAMYEK